MNACLGSFSADLLAQLMDRTPFLWLNPSLGQPLPSGAPTASDIDAAADRMKRCRPLLVSLFPELNTSGGNIESPLLRVAELQSHRGAATGGPWFIKADHALPVAGSIKARGGFHEILALAEELACANGVVSHGYEALKLVSAEARAVFAQHTVSVGSTGNLGLSIGVMAAALGFRTVVYMSSDAKEWKKARLRDRGVIVIEAPGDYAAAVAEGRAASTADPRGYFVDDERSLRLFLGYAAAARPFADQLVAAGRRVDADHPLFVYLPCGVGGAPSGVAGRLTLHACAARFRHR
jgi:D-serine dehydratase